MLKNEDDYNSVSDRDNTRETANAAHQDGEKNGAEREMKVQSTTSAKITQKDSGDKAITIVRVVVKNEERICLKSLYFGLNVPQMK